MARSSTPRRRRSTSRTARAAPSPTSAPANWAPRRPSASDGLLDRVAGHERGLDGGALRRRERAVVDEDLGHESVGAAGPDGGEVGSREALEVAVAEAARIARQRLGRAVDAVVDG